MDESINISIYTINSGKISYPIILTYNMTGIGVDQLASDVGLGWELSNVFIQREVKDKVDVDEGEIAKYPIWSENGYENNPNNTFVTNNNYYFIRKRGYQQVKNNNIKESYGTNSIFNIGQLDHEPDIFHVQSPIFSTTFYYPNSLYSAEELKNNNSIITQEVGEILIDYTSFKSLSDNMSWNKVFNEYKKFFIKKQDGILLTFENPEYIHTITFYKNKYKNYVADMGRGQDFSNTPIADKWHISKISDPQSGREVIFEYETYTTEDTHKNNHQTYTQNNKPYFRSGEWQKDNYLERTNFDPGCYIVHNEDGADYPIKHYTKIYRRYLKKKRIKSISFDNGKIEFIYTLNRDDFHNGKALTRIEIKNKENKLVNSFDFEYGYFESEQYRNEFSKRLKLLSVSQLGGLKQSFEYYEDNKMPQVGSYNKDFYGYCNTPNDDIVNPDDSDQQNSPIYYYYPDKYEFSLMPYNIEGQKKFSLGGIVNKEPNDLAKTWSLKKIKHSTGGYTQYDLETNIFNLWGIDLKGAGIRIASKKIYESDLDTKPRIITYDYRLPNGKSSGTIHNFPLAGYPTKQLFMSYEDDYGVLHSQGSSYIGESNLADKFLLYQVLGNGKTEIKYSEVKKTEGEKNILFNFKTFAYSENGNFRPYTNDGLNYFSAHCIFDFLYTNSGIGSDNQKNILHYLSSSKVFKNNDLVAEQKYLYNNVFERQSDPLLYTPNENHLKLNSIITSKIAFHDTPYYDFKDLMHTNKKIFTKDNYLVQKENIEYLPGGSKVNKTIYFYHPIISGGKPLLTGTLVMDNEGNSLQHETTYTDERYLGLINANMLTTILGERKLKNGKEISNNTINYSVNSIFPSSILQHSDRQNFKTIASYNMYDDKGNLLSFTDSNGIPTTILYGYRQSYPIAVIKGINYEHLMQELNIQSSSPAEYLNLEIVKKSNQDIDEITEKALILELDNFRKQVNNQGSIYQISTYTYDTLIGITSSTPPSGIREIYKYDTANRLQSILNKDGEILKEYSYNYVPATYTNVERSETFTRNNCGANYIGGQYTYVVPAGRHSSTISQEDADQKAQTDINTNGQNEANINGSCRSPISCAISMSFSGGGGVVETNTTYKATVGFSTGSNSINLPWTTGVKIGTIQGVCKPSVEYNGYNGQVYYKIMTNGDIILRSHSNNIFPNNTTKNYELYYPVN
ncbi:MAG: DUF5977 domain-containing protein [Bergeyella sp.]